MNRGTFFKRILQGAATVAIAPELKKEEIIKPKLLQGGISSHCMINTSDLVDIDMKIIREVRINRFKNGL